MNELLVLIHTMLWEPHGLCCLQFFQGEEEAKDTARKKVRCKTNYFPDEEWLTLIAVNPGAGERYTAYRDCDDNLLLSDEVAAWRAEACDCDDCV